MTCQKAIAGVLVVLFSCMTTKVFCQLTCAQLESGGTADSIEVFGYCWFRPLSVGSTASGHDAACAGVLPGAHAGILPDDAVKAVIYPGVGLSGTDTMRVHGIQYNMTDGPRNGWHWVTPDGNIPIPTSEIAAKARTQLTALGYFPRANTGPDGADSMSVSFELGWMDLYDTQVYPMLLCAKRLTGAQKFTDRKGLVGAGAELGAAKVMQSLWGCVSKCAHTFACLTASWHASANTCQMHYVTAVDYKISVVAGGAADHFYEIK